jgi:hypothetical protein
MSRSYTSFPPHAPPWRVAGQFYFTDVPEEHASSVFWVGGSMFMRKFSIQQSLHTTTQKTTNFMTSPRKPKILHATDKLKLVPRSRRNVKKFSAFYGTRMEKPCSLEPTTSPYPEPDESSLFKISNPNFLRISHVPMRAACPAHVVLLDLMILITFREEQKSEQMELYIVQFSPASCHFVPLRLKYSPQRPVLKTPSIFT